MRLSDLQNKAVCTLDGERVGRVHEVHCENGVIIALKIGAASFLERMTAKNEGRRVRWDCVRKIGRERIVVTPDPPQRKRR